MLDPRPTGLLIDAPIGPLSPPEEIHAWLAQLDQLETEVKPGSDAVRTINMVRKEAREFLEWQAKLIAQGETIEYAYAKRRPAR